MIWGKAGKYRDPARDTWTDILVTWTQSDLNVITNTSSGPCAQCGLGLAPAPVAWAGLGSLTVADCPWPVLANICKHCTAQAAARHMATCVTRAIANITVHGQFLKTANAIPLMATV